MMTTRFMATVGAAALIVALVGCSTTTAAPVAPPPSSGHPVPYRANNQQPEPHQQLTRDPSVLPMVRPAASCPAPPDKPLNSAPRAQGWKGKTVALTFDDGPGGSHDALVKILTQEKIPATFFQTGAHAQAHPAAQRKLQEAGLSVANHTYDHRYPSQVKGGWTQAYLLDQLARTSAVLTEQTDQQICHFRPPGGIMTNIMAATEQARLTVVMWSVDSRDWAQPARTTTTATQSIVKASTTVGQQRHPVVLLHSAKASVEPENEVSSNRSNTVAALPAIIAWYRANGYRFVDFNGNSAA